MTIGSYGLAAQTARRATDTFSGVKSSLSALQLQLSTGKAAQTYAALGADASKSLDLRAKLSTLETYDANIAGGQTRVALMSTALDAVRKAASKTATTLNSYTTDAGQAAAGASAVSAFQLAVDALNTDSAGRYLFSGRAGDTEPVAPAATLLDGSPPRAGLKQLIAERAGADLGTAGMGRLTLVPTGTTVTLAGEAAGLPFGMSVAAASAAGAGLTATLAAGPPASAAFDVTAQPAEGSTVSVTLGMPDGTSQVVTLRAAAAGSTAADTFAIGATPADTAAALGTALAAKVRTVAATTLSAASAMRAATDFFGGSAARPTVRVPGPDFAAATATVPGTAADTVTWYRGESDGGSARETVSVRAGDGTAVAIGARADEGAFRTLLAGLAAVAATPGPATDDTAKARFGALASRAATALGVDGRTTGLDNVISEIAGASHGLKAAGTLNDLTRAHVVDSLAATENADPNAAAVKLLDAQTRLQASYQVTSTVLKLSLVDYLR